jgi:hypothetical protein
LGWTIGVLGGVGALLIGVAVALIALRSREPQVGDVEVVELREPVEVPRDPEPEEQVIDSTRLPGLVAEALRKPLAHLRRLKDCPAEVREPLERLGMRVRLLDARPRPMRATAISPLALLQDAAEQVPLLRTGAVGISWSLRSRAPALLDSERARLAFRELLEACADGAHTGGKVGIRVVGNPDPVRPIRIEVEIGRRFAEVDALALLVVRHLLETQGATVEVDARVTRISLRAPEKETEGEEGEG